MKNPVSSSGNQGVFPGLQPLRLSSRHHQKTSARGGFFDGRGGGIRTHGLFVPNEARYQTALHPELVVRKPPTGRFAEGVVERRDPPGQGNFRAPSIPKKTTATYEPAAQAGTREFLGRAKGPKYPSPGHRPGFLDAPKLQGLKARNNTKLPILEPHKEHGPHVHLITNKRIDVNQCRQLAARSGWGRIHVMRIPKSKALYLAKVLSKERPKAFRRWRLWAGFGKCWEWTKVVKIQVESLHSKVARNLSDTLRWKGNRNDSDRKRMIDQVEENTILNGWTAGLGPDDAPYENCSFDVLFRVARKRKLDASARHIPSRPKSREGV